MVLQEEVDLTIEEETITEDLKEVSITIDHKDHTITTDLKDLTITIETIDHQEDIIIIEKVIDNKIDPIDKTIEISTIEVIEITTDHQEDNTIEISIEEEIIDKIIDHQEDNNKDINQEEKNSEKEDLCNGLKLIKSVQEMTESTSSLKLFHNNLSKVEELC